MYNIRIKQLPKNGDQRNYSLVDRNDLYIKVNPINQDSNVKNTISAVPREEANIEAEGGETVIGDINNDGFLEHSKIVGKRHSEGGVPLNVAPGSFIFSDTKKLKIKDPEVLSIFGVTKFDKGGVTPAKIAQKYPMNNYMNILKDDSTDPITKRTAAQMLKNNLEKLGQLALVQESMKGFPDGIPAIAQSVMAGLQGQEAPGQEEMEGREAAGGQGQMRYGGMTMYQTAGTTKEEQKAKPKHANKITEDGNPVVGFKFYNGITPVTVAKVNLEFGQDNPNHPYIKLSNGENITKAAFQQLITKGFYNNYHGGIGDTYTINQNIQKRTILDSDGKPVQGFDLYSGDKINFKGNDYTVVNPNADNSRGYYSTMKPLRDTFDNTQGIIQVRNNKTGQYEYLEGEDLGDAYKFDKTQIPISPNQAFRNVYPRTETIRVTNPGYDVVGPTYTAQPNQRTEYVAPAASAATNPYGNTNQRENAQAIDTTLTETERSQKVVIKEDNSKPAAKTTVTSNTNAVQKPVKKVAGKMQTIPNFIVPSGPYQGQQVRAVQRGDTIRAYYPNGTHEAFLNGKVIPGYKHGGDLPKHQGDAGSSTVGDASASSMMDDGSSNGFFGGIGDFFSELFSGDDKSKTDSATSSLDQQAMAAVANPAAVSASTSVNIPPAATNPTVANSQLFTPEATSTPAFQPFMANTAQGIENGSVAPVFTGDPNKQVIANNNPTFEINPSSVKSLPFTPKDKSTYAPWKPENYDKQWKPMAEQAMLNPEGAKAIDEYMTGLIKSNTFGPNIAAQLEGLTGQARYDKILELATDGKPGLFHNAFLEAMTKKPETPKETPGETPAKKRAWSCRQDPATGVKEIYEFEYEGEMPSGSYNTREEAEAGCNGQPAPQKPKRRRPWWIQDDVYYAGTMTDMIDKYGPAMSQVDFETPGYVIGDPDRRIAAMQEAAAAEREAAYNTTAGNVAGASQVAPSNQRLGQAANIIADVENQNAGIVNQALGRNAQINNQERLTNEQFKQKYIAESALAKQNYDNARRDLKWRQLRAFNQGTSNFQRTNQLESMFPQYAFDRISGDIDFTNGRQAYDEFGNPMFDPYVNPTNPTGRQSRSDSGYLSGAEIAALKKEYIDAGFTDKEAIELISQQTGRSGSNWRTPQNMLANAVMTGNTIPTQRKYGGYTKQYGGTVIDYGALPLYFFED